MTISDLLEFAILLEQLEAILDRLNIEYLAVKIAKKIAARLADVATIF